MYHILETLILRLVSAAARRHYIQYRSDLESNMYFSPLDKNCPICLDKFTNPKRTKCGHQFCSGCLKEALKHDPFCPTCKQPLRSIIGKQPVGGQMTHRVCSKTYINV